MDFLIVIITLYDQKRFSTTCKNAYFSRTKFFYFNKWAFDRGINMAEKNKEIHSIFCCTNF